MEPERIPRRYYKPDERRRIAERCASSGLSQSEFARRHGLSLSSLQRWLSEVRSTPKELRSVVFQEVAVSPPLVGSTTWAVEIAGPDGVTVRCRDRWSVEDVARFVRGCAC